MGRFCAKIAYAPNSETSCLEIEFSMGSVNFLAAYFRHCTSLKLFSLLFDVIAFSKKNSQICQLCNNVKAYFTFVLFPSFNCSPIGSFFYCNENF